ncbi:hypothetical protein BgiBS90_009340 [Biomphalaria glabrata]|nr:hypothetical protein BgiBS90_009340 [Biomphalaria glabrata]
MDGLVCRNPDYYPQYDTIPVSCYCDILADTVDQMISPDKEKRGRVLLLHSSGSSLQKKTMDAINVFPA